MNQKQIKTRLIALLTIVTLIFVVLIGRLAHVQLIQVDQYRLQSEQNRIRMISVPPRRGDVLATNGTVLATSYPSYSITVANLGTNMDDVYERLIDLLSDYGIELTVEQIKEEISSRGYRRFEPVPLLQDVPFELVTLIKERQQELPGVDIQVDPRRVYPNGSLAGHMLGYVMQINQNQLSQYREHDYRGGDPFGQTGLERVFEFMEINGQEVGLRGQKGVRQVEVNASNRPIRELLTIPSVPGNNLVLTIDSDLQEVLETALVETIELRAEVDNPKANAGAGVVIDVNTGAILAMASYPDMDPNDYDFINGLSSERREYYNSDSSPLLNRVFQATYAPGSTFKMVPGIASLEQGTLATATNYCGGRYPAPAGIRCLRAHGNIDYYRAMAVSCNTYFQDAGVKAGPEEMYRVATELGLGARTGIILPGEQAGLAPNPDWKEELNQILIDRRYENLFEQLEEEYKQLISEAEDQEEVERLIREQERRKRQLESEYRIDYNFHTTWHPFDTFNTSIGQGSNNYTILQLANYAATIANDGTVWVPRLVDKIVTPRGEIVKQFEPEVLNQADISSEALAETREAMRRVTQPGGTAYSRFAHFPSDVTVAAKTGTAQTGLARDDKNRDYHGMFVGFAPYDNPEIAFAGIIEYGGGGGTSAGLVAQAVFEQYFGLNEDDED
ncbi:penicillin-binding protein 2 [Desulfitispora alkaliphila]|uniref:penicillin-binding protein 2 n=1 Tax=Desulfitispora alkaliphila TaxID=622674 RepID=UPI003D1F549C